MADPLYRRLGEQIASRIGSGAFPIGSFLPTEAELCAEFGVSHHTIREALKLVIERGLVVRRAGSGSRVIALHEPTVFAHIASDLRHVFSYPENALRENIQQDFVAADPALSALLGCTERTPWFHIGAIRRDARTKAAICWTDFYILPRYSEIVKSKTHLTVPVYEQIERIYGQKVQSAEVDFSIARLDDAIAGRLGQRPGSPAMRIIRRYCDEAGSPFEATVTWHPEQGQYRCVMSFQRERRVR